ncbi:hypothetical protein Avbf_04225 [Armadillidium vulgare]|nr:hypothetical protein Avbf_04225 [Armadillidium vulgare]
MIFSLKGSDKDSDIYIKKKCVFQRVANSEDINYLFTLDSRFTSYPPSMVAAAAVASAIQGILPRHYCEGPQELDTDPNVHPASRGASSASSSSSSSSNIISNSSSSIDMSGSTMDISEYAMSSESSVHGSTSRGTITKRFMQNLYHRLHSITQIDTDCLRECHRQIEIWTQRIRGDGVLRNPPIGYSDRRSRRGFLRRAHLQFSPLPQWGKVPKGLNIPGIPPPTI